MMDGFVQESDKKIDRLSFMSRVMSRGGIEGLIGGTDRLAIRHL